MPLLQLQGVRKHFGAVEALKGVDFTVRAGLVTALVGDNGAGKSTLIKCIAGINPIDSGSMVWEGQLVTIADPSDGAALGIEVVYQDLALCDNLDVVQNMFLGPRDPHRAAPPRRGDDGGPYPRDAGLALGHHDQLGTPAGRRASRAASASRWPWPAP